MLSRKALEFILESNKIDWNTIDPDTLTLETVERASAGDPTTPQEIRDHCKAFERMEGIARNIGTPMFPKITPLSLDLHSTLTKNILSPQESGKFRQWGVWIGSEVAPRWFLIPHYMERFQSFFEHACAGTNYSASPWAMHDEFECIHPFSDGNGRIGRLLFAFCSIKWTGDFSVIKAADRAEYYGRIRRYRADQFRLITDRPQTAEERTQESLPGL